MVPLVAHQIIRQQSKGSIGVMPVSLSVSSLERAILREKTSDLEVSARAPSDHNFFFRFAVRFARFLAFFCTHEPIVPWDKLKNQYKYLYISMDITCM